MTTGESTHATLLTWRGVTARRLARHALAAPATDLDRPASPAW